MTTEYWIYAGILLVLIVMSAFFSGSETALTASSRGRMHSLEKQGDERARTVNALLDKRDRLIGTLLIGNNLVNISASAIATALFLSLFGESGIAWATLMMTVIVVIFGEIMPKSWAFLNAERFALAVAPVIQIIVFLFAPFAAVAAWIVRAILRVFGIYLDAGESMLSAHEEIRGAVEVLAREGSVIKDDRYRLGGILDLHELEVSDVMIHRTQMLSINGGDSPEAIIKQVTASPYTRMPVWRDDPENIVGVVHARDVLRFIAAQEDISKFDVMKIASKPWFVPENTPLKDQLNAFLRRKAHIAVVVDEYGEVRGLVTLEDILEEIVGEISDEPDIDVAGVQTQADGSVIVEGGVPIRDINRALDWELPDDEATTVAGLVIHEAQMIPEEKQAFTFYGKRFVVMRREKNRITKLRIRNLQT
ncbi:MAG TPA: HlyC/CorC family transporter [Rhizobiaceae bacterium]|nr:HlyC/CorC family transporter [Rhizobiaceae bacterium]